MPPELGRILKEAVERFYREQGRWPRSLEEMTAAGLAGFGASCVVGFDQATEDAICLRNTHRKGKAVVRVSRPGDGVPEGPERFPEII